MSYTSRNFERISIIRRYSNVANDLPEGAKQVLSSQMGSIKVSPRDSFELYLLELSEATPKLDIVMFNKRFAEIFEKKGKYILKKIQKNRENKKEFYISNDYFGQEFRDLFNVEAPQKNDMNKSMMQFERAAGEMWNKILKGCVNLVNIINRVGINGIIQTKGITGATPKVREVKWK